MLLLINSLEYKTNLRLSRSSMLMNETNHNISITQWCWRELAKSQLGLTIRPLRVRAQPSHVMSSQTRASSYNACWNAIWEPCATDAAQSTCLGEAWSSASNRRVQQDHRWSQMPKGPWKIYGIFAEGPQEWETGLIPWVLWVPMPLLGKRYVSYDMRDASIVTLYKNYLHCNCNNCGISVFDHP